MTETITVDDLVLKVRRSDRRSTVGITVERDGVVTVTAPSDCTQDFIEQTIEKKLFWIYEKLSEKELLLQGKREREFVSGESFFYRGKAYRLILVDDHQPSVLRFRQRAFYLSKYEQPNAREHFINWYTRNSKIWLWQRTHLFTERLGEAPRGIYVADIGHKWGVCDHEGIITFHWQTILLPPATIDYIVVHELAHLFERNHSNEFWQIIARIIPDYRERKRWLAENGAMYCL
jgi:predicted metal-dependent hydrolase